MPAEIDLVICLVAPIGTDLDSVTRELSGALSAVGWDLYTAHLTKDFCTDSDGKPAYDRSVALMDEGDRLRREAGRNDAVAAVAVSMVKKIRNSESSDRAAVLIRQLKTPEEVESLRHIYGARLFVVSCYASRQSRVERLARSFANSEHESQAAKYRAKAEELVLRDEQDSEKPTGQNVRKAFPEADAFVAVADPERTRDSVKRIVEVLFRHPYRTPSRDEYGMYLAEAAAMRSSALGRQVGAVITTEYGDPIAVGANEVPKAGGGLYWEGDKPDERDFQLGYDTNDKFKENLVGEFISRLRGGKWLSNEHASKDVASLVRDLIHVQDGLLRGAQVDGIIEFGRCVHAEMAAIVDAARRGVSVDDGVLFTTTFPCHECARHIVAAGITRVVYRVPYPKSLVRELYPDSIDVEVDKHQSGKVAFDPFVGIAPRRYMQFFRMGKRKDGEGKVLAWPALDTAPNRGDYFPPTDLVEKDEDSFLTDFADNKRE